MTVAATERIGVNADQTQKFRQFLKWALPRLGMRWEGFRKVYGQVVSRVRARMAEIGLRSVSAYRDYLEENPEEWAHLDTLCVVTISRFYRDADVFDFLRSSVVPKLARLAIEDGREELRVWSAGAASGEEAYTVRLLWDLAVGRRFDGLGLFVIGTELKPHMIERARRAWYPASCLRELPDSWRDCAFRVDAETEEYRLREEFRREVEFSCQDVRDPGPAGYFDCILCRNLVFTYFDEPTQREVLEQLLRSLRARGALVVGGDERLPETDSERLETWSGTDAVFQLRRAATGESGG